MHTSATRPLPTPDSLRESAGRVCVALSGPEMFEAAQAHVPRERFFELRLDSLPDPASSIGDIHRLLQENPGITAVATCRRTAYGGGFHGDAKEQIEVLCRAAEAGCSLVDIETETAEELGSAALKQLRTAGAAVIMSWHDFDGTPDLARQLYRMTPFAADLRKIVPTATTLRDALKVMALLKEQGADGRLIAMSMGFRGTLTRVLGPAFGSAFTFAAPDTGAGTAPGQMAVSTLRYLYRVERLSPQTAVYGVAGVPITGSLSPQMHNTAFAAAGMDAVYLPLETGDMDELLEVIADLRIRGLSITMPLKESVLPRIRHASAEVEEMQTCNTLRCGDDGLLHGFNTDVNGIVGPLKRRLKLDGARVLVLGAGGAARSAVFGLKNAGASVFLLNRTPARAEALAAESGTTAIHKGQLRGLSFDIIVNATPYGMRNQHMEAPIPAEDLRSRVFFDLVYNPAETPLMKAAAAQGAVVIAGAEMFVEQGARQFEIWTGEAAPKDAMLHAVEQALA